MEYSKEISSLLGNSNSSPTPIIEDPKVILKVNLGFERIFAFVAARVG